MQQEPAKRAVAMLSALSQPTRLRIVEVVASAGAEGVPAGQIARSLHCPASTLSFHLKELAQAGLLTANPQGRFIRYVVVPDAFAQLGEFVRELGGGPASKSRGPRRAQAARKVRGNASPPRHGGQLSIFED